MAYTHRPQQRAGNIGDPSASTTIPRAKRGAEPSYVDTTIYDPTGGGNDIPGGQFQDQRTWIDYLRGAPDLASQYNNQLLLNQLQGNQQTAQQIALAKQMQPITQAGQTFTANLNEQQQRKEQLNKSINQMQAEQDAVENAARYDPTSLAELPSNQITGQDRSPLMKGSFDVHNPRQYNEGGDPDPHLMFLARQNLAAPGLASNAATASTGRLQQLQNQSAMSGVPDLVKAKQNEELIGNQFNAAQRQLGLDELNQNRGINLQTSGVNAGNELLGAQGNTSVIGQMPKAKLDAINSETAQRQATADFMSGAKTGLTDAERQKATVEMLNKNDPMRVYRNMTNTTANPNPANPGTPLTTPITAQPMSIKPITEAKPVIDYTINPDGSRTTLIDIIDKNGKIIKAGTIMQKNKK